VKEAPETRRTTTGPLQETNDIAKATNNIAKVIQSMPSPKASYASVLDSNTDVVTLQVKDHEKSPSDNCHFTSCHVFGLARVIRFYYMELR